MNRDELLTLTDIRRPYRMQAAAGLLPFNSLTATRKTLCMPENSSIDTALFHLYIEPQTELLKGLAELRSIGKRRHMVDELQVS